MTTESNGNADNKNLHTQITETLMSIRPSLQSHGGDLELVEITDDLIVKVKLQGACKGCPGARATLKNGVERVLKERVPTVKEVVAVQ